MGRAPRDIFLLTRDPEDAPAQPRYVEIELVAGVPVTVDGERMGPSRFSRTSTPSPASTASAASTSSRTATSA